MRALKRRWYQLLQWQDYMLGVWSCKAMQIRGYSSSPVHPKHLFDERRSEFLHDFFRQGIRFLDLGAGVGTDCIIASEKGAIVSIGLEGNPKSITTATQRVKDKGVAAEFIPFDIEQGKLPFADNSFELINFSNVLEHLYNRDAVLKEIKRVKTTDGTVVISIPNAETTWKQKLSSVGLDSRDDPDHKVEYTKDSLRDELGAAGLAISSELMPIIPSFPWNGVIAMSAFLSPKLYKKLQLKKREFVENNPDESIGWVFTVN